MNSEQVDEAMELVKRIVTLHLDREKVSRSIEDTYARLRTVLAGVPDREPDPEYGLGISLRQWIWENGLVERSPGLMDQEAERLVRLMKDRGIGWVRRPAGQQCPSQWLLPTRLIAAEVDLSKFVDADDVESDG